MVWLVWSIIIFLHLDHPYGLILLRFSSFTYIKLRTKYTNLTKLWGRKTQQNQTSGTIRTIKSRDETCNFDQTIRTISVIYSILYSQHKFSNDILYIDHFYKLVIRK